MKNIIAISGKMGSGKDTIGEIIQYISAESKIDMVSQNQSVSLEDLIKGKFKENSDWEIKKMAGKLKDIASILIGCTREQLEDREFKEKELGEQWLVYKSHGSIFTTWQEAYEYCGEQESDVDSYTLTPRLMLQLLGTDCARKIIHPNTWANAFWADYKIENNPKWIITDCRFPNEADSIKERNGIIIRVERGNIKSSNHPSETGLDDYKDFDYVIQNNGTIEELIDKVRGILIKESILEQSEQD
jgi:hypothetical protein